jgi:CrcB protein
MGDYDPVLPGDPELAPDHSSEPVDPSRAALPQHRHRRLQPDVLAAIAFGGAIGAAARFEVAQAIPAAPGQFPWATFWANMSGSLVLGFVLILLLERFPPTRYLRPFLATGVIGAYTTMSTYLVETAILIKDGHVDTGLLYGIGSLVVGLILAFVGIVAARLIPHRRHHRSTAQEQA